MPVIGPQYPHIMSWHPILATTEPIPGTWHMHGPLDEIYATIVMIRRGPELGYRVTTSAGEHIGFYRTLMSASKAAHTWFVSTRGPHGVPHAGYAGKEWGT